MKTEDKKVQKFNYELEDQFLKIYKKNIYEAQIFCDSNNLMEIYWNITDIHALAKHIKVRQISVKVFFIIVSILFVFLIYKCSSSDSSSSQFENPQSISVHPVEKWMSDLDGSIFDFNYKVEKMLDDPDSFEHVETSYSKAGDDKVRMKFRAKNKFGAKVLNQADAVLNTIDGTVSNITINQY